MARRHGQWNAIERLFDLCSPTERGNDFAHAGYGADMSRKSLSCRRLTIRLFHPLINVAHRIEHLGL